MLLRLKSARGRLGCQGEVGAAAAMAAGALTAVLGGTPEQIEHAASISLEHTLGLACRPEGGLIQSPCIERNITAAATALSVVRAVLEGTAQQPVALDMAVRALHACSLAMRDQFKDVANGRLTVNVVEC